MASTTEVAIFVDTNMGTHIALAVSPNITAADFKRELEVEHFNCFPELGEIGVIGLKVKRKSSFYQIPESMLVKHVFHGLTRTRFLCMDAMPLNDLVRPISSTFEPSEIRAHVGNSNFVENSLALDYVTIRNRENSSRDEITGVHNKEEGKKRTSTSPVETPSELSSQAVSVTSILRRYFSNFNDMGERNTPSTSDDLCDKIQSQPGDQLKDIRNPYCANIQTPGERRSMTARRARRAKRKPPPLLSTPASKPLKNKLKGPQVGNRLVTASCCLGTGLSKRTPLSSLCRADGGKLLKPSVRSLVFEMSDSDD